MAQKQHQTTCHTPSTWAEGEPLQNAVDLLEHVVSCLPVLLLCSHCALLCSHCACYLQCCALLFLADFVSRGGRLVHHVANEGESHWVLHVGALRSCPCLFRADPYQRPEVSTAQVGGIPELTWDAADDGGVAAVQVLAQLREAWAQQPLANTKDCAVSAWITSLAAAMGAERNGGPVGPNDRWTMARVLLCMTLGPMVETPPVLSLPHGSHSPGTKSSCTETPGRYASGACRP